MLPDDDAERAWLPAAPTVAGTTSVTIVDPTIEVVTDALSSLHDAGELTDQQRAWAQELLANTPAREVLALVSSWLHGGTAATFEPTVHTDIEGQAMLVCIAGEVAEADLDRLDDVLADAIFDVGSVRGRLRTSGGVVMYVYGDAELMWMAAEGSLRSAELPAGSYVLLRNGGPGTSARRIDL